MLVVDVVDRTGRLTPTAIAVVRANVERAGAKLGAGGEVRLAVIDDAEMTAAHDRFLGIPETTDVLTFDLAPPENRGPKPDIGMFQSGFERAVSGLDTDILVCLDVAHRHAEAGRYPIERELTLYAVHGVLHCLGWDDHDPAEAAAMHRLEDVVLEVIGVGAVYDPGG